MLLNIHSCLDEFQNTCSSTDEQEFMQTQCFFFFFSSLCLQGAVHATVRITDW